MENDLLGRYDSLAVFPHVHFAVRAYMDNIPTCSF